MDFLLIVIRQFLKKSSNTKIVLMSATMDAEHFAAYFEQRVSFKVPILNMDVDGPFEIITHFLDEFCTYAKKMVEFETPCISDEIMHLAAEIVFNHVKLSRKSSILVFLPGFYEIENFERVLLSKFDVHQCLDIIILHSAITTEDQKLAFSCDVKPKIILSTNIAENSVTIPTVNVVIDFCLTKYLIASPESNMAALKLDWASKTSCLQRRGRTGRVCDGNVYHMVPQRFFDMNMLMFAIPEMKRIPLERVILKTKLIDSETYQSPRDFLSRAIDPPKIDSVRNSILVLKELGALQRYDLNGNFEVDDGELTFIGRVMACLPCDIYIGKFIMLGYAFSMLKETVIIAAGLSINGSIFKYNNKNRLDTYSKRIRWSDGSGSDLIAILNAYQLWRKNVAEQIFTSKESEQIWFENANLDSKNMYEMKALIKEIRARLLENHVQELQEKGIPNIHEDIDKPLMLKVCVAGAWLPFYYVLQTRNVTSDEREAHKEVEGADIHRSIFFLDTEQKYISLYNDILKQFLVKRGICSSVEDIDIMHNAFTNRVVATFRRNEVPENKRDQIGVSLIDGNILPEVYVAVKEKEISHGTLKVHVMSHSSMRRYAQTLNYPMENDSRSSKSLSSSAASVNSSASSFTLGVSELKGHVTHVVDCGKFFFQPTGGRYSNEMRLMVHRINLTKFKNPIEQELELSHNDKVIILYDDKKQRGIVSKPPNEALRFRLIDVGIVTSDIPLSSVYHCPKTLMSIFDDPERCFECCLAETAPSALKVKALDVSIFILF